MNLFEPVVVALGRMWLEEVGGLVKTVWRLGVCVVLGLLD